VNCQWDTLQQQTIRYLSFLLLALPPQSMRLRCPAMSIGTLGKKLAHHIRLRRIDPGSRHSMLSKAESRLLPSSSAADDLGSDGLFGMATAGG
jgi:hypothetical protein